MPAAISNPHTDHTSSAWPVIVLGFFALAISFSARAALSLAMPVWNREMGWAPDFTSFAGAAALIVMAGVAPFAGNLVDRYGPTRLLAVGLLALGAGMLMVATAQSRWSLLLGFSLIGAIGFGMVAQHVVATAIALSAAARPSHWPCHIWLDRRAAAVGAAAGLAATGGELADEFPGARDRQPGPVGFDAAA